MKLLLNNLFVAVFILFGTMSLQAQQTDTHQQQTDQEITDLIDRLDNLMARALQLDENEFDDARREGVGVDTEREDIEQDQDQEGVGVQRERGALGQEQQERDEKQKKMVKRFGENLGLTIGNLKQTAESYQQLLEEDGQQSQGISGAGVQENDAQQQDEDAQQQQQQERTDAEDNEQMRQDLEQVRGHLIALADEMEKAVEAVEKLNGSERSGQTEFDTEEY